MDLSSAPSVDGATVDWSLIKFVVFDVDGTLYAQTGMRRAMAGELLMHSARRLSLRTLRLLKLYRHLREEAGSDEMPAFEAHVRAAVASEFNMAPEAVGQVVEEWMEQRPQKYLAKLRYAGLTELFDALRRRAITIGILSDHPARAKTAALGLEADVIVAATDPDVDMCKPHPKGLEHAMAKAGVGPGETVLIGDRADRDGDAAVRAGVLPLLRSATPQPGWITFATYHDEIFAPLLEAR